MKTFKKKKAFTLIELLVSLAITAIVLFIATDITVKLIRQGEKSDIRAEVDRNVSFSLEIIKRNVRQSTSSNISAPIIIDANNNILKIQSSASSTGYRYFRRFVPSGTKGYLYQCDDATCATNPVALTGSDVDVNAMFFTYADSFVEMSLKVFDKNKIVYPSTALSVVTGALVRN